MLVAIRSECRSQSRRNSGRNQIGMPVAIDRNTHASTAGDGITTYRGVTFDRSEAEASKYAAQRGGRTGITTTGAMLYIRSVLSELGMAVNRDWGRVRRGEMTMDEVAELLVSGEGPNVAFYQGIEFSTASVIAFAEENGKEITLKVAKEYIRYTMKKQRNSTINGG